MTREPAHVFSGRRGETFIVDNDDSISYGLFLVRCKRLAEYIRQTGAGRVCVHADKTTDYFYSFIAALLVGATIVPLASGGGTDSRGEILSIVEPGLLLDTASIRQAIAAGDEDIGESEWQSALSALERVDPGREFLVTFTSGTTSVPKGVVHSFANLWRTAEAFGAGFGFDSSHVFYHHFPIAYMAGILNQFILPMRHGCKVVVGPRFEARAAMDFWREPVARGATVFWMSPTMLQMLMTLDRGTRGIEYCREKNIVILCGTAPLTVKLRTDFERRYGIPVYESYGLTETLFISTNSPRSPVRDGCSGTVLEGVTPALSADEELRLACEWMFLRYFNAESALDEAGVFRTGDLASITANGELYITGRKKDLIIRGGVNISPGRIERLLGAADYLPEFCVLGCPDQLLGEKVTLAYIAGRELELEKKKKVNSLLQGKLDSVSGIDEFMRVDAFPRNANGKIDKNRLRVLLRRPDKENL